MLQVKSVLSAALYPNVAVMDDGAGPNARPTWHDGQGSVAVHPSSVNHPLIAVQYMRPYLVYLEKVCIPLVVGSYKQRDRLLPCPCAQAVQHTNSNASLCKLQSGMLPQFWECQMT